MLSFRAATSLQKAGFRRPRQFRVGQHWYTPEGRLGVVVKSSDDCVLLQFTTGTVAQFNFAALIYAPTLEEIFDGIARAGKHRLLSRQPGSKEFEVLGVNLQQYITGKKAAEIMAKEFCRITRSS